MAKNLDYRAMQVQGVGWNVFGKAEVMLYSARFSSISLFNQERISMLAFNFPPVAGGRSSRRGLLQALTLALLVVIFFTNARSVHAAASISSSHQHAQASVTAGDIICSMILFFDHECGLSVQAAQVDGTAQLAVADAQATVGVSTTLTVTLNTGGNAIAAATFALNLDPAKLQFSDTDTDEDGVPEAITLHVPPSMNKTVIWNPEQKRLEVAVFGMSLPLPTLSDGVLANIQVQVATDATASTTPLTLTLVSLSDPDGNDLPVTQANGTFVVQPRVVAPTGIFLPLVVR